MLWLLFQSRASSRGSRILSAIVVMWHLSRNGRHGGVNGSMPMRLPLTFLVHIFCVLSYQLCYNGFCCIGFHWLWSVPHNSDGRFLVCYLLILFLSYLVSCFSLSITWLPSVSHQPFAPSLYSLWSISLLMHVGYECTLPVLLLLLWLVLSGAYYGLTLKQAGSKY